MFKRIERFFTYGAVIKNVTDWGGRVLNISEENFIPQHKMLFWFRTPTKNREKVNSPTTKKNI